MLEEPTSRPTIVFDPIPNMCARLFYCDPAAFDAAFGLCLAPDSIWLDFSSIHWSSLDFLKRQRLPSLKAGIFCSPTYLYSVSGLTPRYCDAWRMFMTSRESAIVPFPFHRIEALFVAGVSGHRANWERIPRTDYVRVNSGVPSIYQPANSSGQGLFPCFAGFYACFLESNHEGFTTGFYILRLYSLHIQYVDKFSIWIR